MFFGLTSPILSPKPLPQVEQFDIELDLAIGDKKIIDIKMMKILWTCQI